MRAYLLVIILEGGESGERWVRGTDLFYFNQMFKVPKMTITIFLLAKQNLFIDFSSYEFFPPKNTLHLIVYFL